MNVGSPIEAMATPSKPAEPGAVSAWRDFEPPALPEADKLRAAIARARSLTPKEVLAISVRAGIHNEDGSLTEKYRR